MSKYLFHLSYTPEGAKGLLKEGGKGRADAAARLVESLGGKLEGCYFAFGETDAYVLADLPSPEAAAALALNVSAAGAVTAKTTVLLTPEQLDATRGLKPEYRPPGG
ncbi:MAG TPA: GYD domain-containing protein [Acidimicrobiales bacterium]